MERGYGAVSDVTGMLYLQPDMAGFARSPPLAHPPGEAWLYSSGTAVILSRIAQDAQRPANRSRQDLASFIKARLFEPIGITTATIEADEHGTLVGSSYMYATARDWARYGLFLLQDGIWQGEELLPPGYVAMMATPVAASRGQYGMGQTWLWGSDAVTPGVNPDAAFGIPPGYLLDVGPRRPERLHHQVAPAGHRALRVDALRRRLHPQRLVQAVLERAGSGGRAGSRGRAGRRGRAGCRGRPTLAQ